MARSSSTSPRAKNQHTSRDRLSDAPMPVIRGAIPVDNTPAPPGAQITEGPRAVTGYRDGADGRVDTTIFYDGEVAAGWHDTPAKCRGDWRAGMRAVSPELRRIQETLNEPADDR